MICEVCDGEFTDYHEDDEPGARVCSIMCEMALIDWFNSGGDLKAWRWAKRWRFFLPPVTR
jgi:hypothetical protein